LRQAFEFTNSYCMPQPEFLLSRASDKFDAEGKLTDQPTRDFLQKYLIAFHEWVLRLKTN
jgi:chromate reductase